MATESFIPGKDASLESTIHTMQQKLAVRGFVLDESSWLNPVESIWSVHVRDLRRAHAGHGHAGQRHASDAAGGL